MIVALLAWVAWTSAAVVPWWLLAGAAVVDCGLVACHILAERAHRT